MNTVILILILASFIGGAAVGLNYKRIQPVHGTRRRDAWLVLLIPLFGLFAIFSDGHFNPKVVPFSLALSIVCWLGWLGALLCGVLMLAGKWPGHPGGH